MINDSTCKTYISPYILEPNSVYKKSADVVVTILFPDTYKHTLNWNDGHILYNRLNRIQGVFAERVYLPLDSEQTHKLRTVETGRPAENADIIFVVLPEPKYLVGAVWQLLRMRVEPLKSKRLRGPYLWTVGAGTSNPTPALGISDTVLTGEIEAFLNGVELPDFCTSATELLDILHKGPGCITGSTAGLDINAPYIESLDKAETVTNPIVPAVNTGISTASIEISRRRDGLPYRRRTPESTGQIADTLLANTGEPVLNLRGDCIYSMETLPEIIHRTLKASFKHNAKLVITNNPVLLDRPNPGDRIHNGNITAKLNLYENIDTQLEYLGELTGTKKPKYNIYGYIPGPQCLNLNHSCWFPSSEELTSEIISHLKIPPKSQGTQVIWGRISDTMHLKLDAALTYGNQETMEQIIEHIRHAGKDEPIRNLMVSTLDVIEHQNGTVKPRPECWQWIKWPTVNSQIPVELPMSFCIFPGRPAVSSRWISYVIHYHKRKGAAFLTHQAISRYIELALRKTGVTLIYQNGKTRRPAFSFGPVTPAGAESIAEYVLFLMNEYRSEQWLLNEIPKYMPAGIDIKSVKSMPYGTKKLPAIKESVYEMKFSDTQSLKQWAAAASKLKSGPVWVSLKDRKGKETQLRVDSIIRPGHVSGLNASVSFRPRSKEFIDIPGLLKTVIGWDDSISFHKRIALFKTAEIRGRSS